MSYSVGLSYLSVLPVLPSSCLDCMFPLSFLLLSLLLLFSRIFYPFSLSVLSFRSSSVSLIFSIVSFAYIISVTFFLVFPAVLFSLLSVFRCPLFIPVTQSSFLYVGSLCHVVTVCPFCMSFLVLLSVVSILLLSALCVFMSVSFIPYVFCPF